MRIYECVMHNYAKRSSLVVSVFEVRRLGAAFVLDGLPSRYLISCIKLRLMGRVILFRNKARVSLTLPYRNPKNVTLQYPGCVSVHLKNFANFASFAAK